MIVCWLILLAYKEKNGHVRVPVVYVDETGFALGKWVSRQKSNEKISEERKAQLTALGVTFEKTDPWEVRYALAKQFYEKYGHLNVPAKYNETGVNLNIKIFKKSLFKLYWTESNIIK